MSLAKELKTDFYPDRKKAYIKVGRKCLPAILRGLSDQFAMITTHTRLEKDQEVLVRVSFHEEGTGLKQFYIPCTIVFSTLTENVFSNTLKIQAMDEEARSNIDHYLLQKNGLRTGRTRRMINRGIEAQTGISLN